MRSKWLSRNERDYWVCEFSRFGADRQALADEIQAAQAVIRQQPANSLLVAVDLYDAPMTPELIAFLKASGEGNGNPIRKMAIIGVYGARKAWYEVARRVVWPRKAVFFRDWEKAKDWLVDETF